MFHAKILYFTGEQPFASKTSGESPVIRKYNPFLVLYKKIIPKTNTITLKMTIKNFTFTILKENNGEESTPLVLKNIEDKLWEYGFLAPLQEYEPAELKKD